MNAAKGATVDCCETIAGVATNKKHVKVGSFSTIERSRRAEKFLANLRIKMLGQQDIVRVKAHPSLLRHMYKV